MNEPWRNLLFKNHKFICFQQMWLFNHDTFVGHIWDYSIFSFYTIMLLKFEFRFILFLFLTGLMSSLCLFLELRWYWVIILTGGRRGLWWGGHFWNACFYPRIMVLLKQGWEENRISWLGLFCLSRPLSVQCSLIDWFWPGVDPRSLHCGAQLRSSLSV